MLRSANSENWLKRSVKPINEGIIDFLELCCFLPIFIRVLGIDKSAQEDQKGKQGNYNVNSETSL